VIADELGWDSGDLSKGQCAEVTMTANMEITCFCVFHSHLKGKLVVFCLFGNWVIMPNKNGIEQLAGLLSIGALHALVKGCISDARCKL